MEIRKALEELEITNDINTLTPEELRQKYLQNEQSFNYFMERFPNYFFGHMFYPLRVADEYQKIAQLINDGNKLYPNDNNMAHQEQILSEMVSLGKRYSIEKGSTGDDKIEAQFLFLAGVGERKSNGSHNYVDTVSDIYDAAGVYANKGNYPLDDFRSYIRCKMMTSHNRAELNQSVDRYIVAHPLATLCNETSYLYFVNYMLDQYRNEVDEEFIKDARDVVETGKVLQELGFVRPNFDRKEYNKVARYTFKHIKVCKNKKVKDAKTKEKAIKKQLKK